MRSEAGTLSILQTLFTTLTEPRNIYHELLIFTTAFFIYFYYSYLYIFGTTLKSTPLLGKERVDSLYFIESCLHLRYFEKSNILPYSCILFFVFLVTLMFNLHNLLHPRTSPTAPRRLELTPYDNYLSAVQFWRTHCVRVTSND